MRIYSIGVGTYGEAPFVVDSPFGGRQRQMVPVEIDEDMLRSIAQQTNGQYFRAVNEQALRDIYAQIGELETTEIETRIYTDYEERYIRYLIPGLILLMQNEPWYQITNVTFFIVCWDAPNRCQFAH